MQRYVLVVSLSDLSLSNAVETDIDWPKAVWFSEISPYAVVAVAGVSGEDVATDFFMVSEEGVPSSVDMSVPGSVVANEPFNISVEVRDFYGNPSNAPVVIAEVGNDGLHNLTVLTTGVDGSASGYIVLRDRGVHRLIAYFPGNSRYLSGFSKASDVVVTEMVSGGIDLPVNHTVEGVPVTARVSLVDSVTREPVSGV
ncbi:MAG: hypothetical protein F7B59_02475 [Desulfurococcales archaeon]|nr:hypothetical protein [Desulfurococcales archaeon]